MPGGPTGLAAAADDWGRGFALVVRGDRPRAGRARPRAGPALDALSYGEQIEHPLLIGMARTIRGLARAEPRRPGCGGADARAVLAVVEPHNVLDVAEVGPRVLRAGPACGRRRGDGGPPAGAGGRRG
jgi:hypothetical protein